MWQAISLLSTAGRQSSGLAGALDALGFNDPPPPVKFSPLNLPPQFVHYRVEREIAAGGMGMVYDAEDARLGRRVALKMLRRVLFSTKQERLRFQTEAELVSLLDHSNIFPVYDVGVHEGQPYFTMKFIPGATARGAHIWENPVREISPPATAVRLKSRIHAPASGHGGWAALPLNPLRHL